MKTHTLSEEEELIPLDMSMSSLESLESIQHQEIDDEGGDYEIHIDLVAF